LLRDFRRYLIQEKIDIAFKDAKLKRKRRSSYYPTNHTNNHPNKWPWIEVLLKTPIADFRKFTMWRILAPYLINIKKLSYGDTFNVIKDWLNKCDFISKMDFNVDQRIEDNLKAVMNKTWNEKLFVDFGKDGNPIKADARAKEIINSDSKNKKLEGDWIKSLLKLTFDVPLFGALIPVRAVKDNGDGRSQKLTGPLQFGIGRSINQVN